MSVPGRRGWSCGGMGGRQPAAAPPWWCLRSDYSGSSVPPFHLVSTGECGVVLFSCLSGLGLVFRQLLIEGGPILRLQEVSFRCNRSLFEAIGPVRELKPGRKDDESLPHCRHWKPGSQMYLYRKILPVNHPSFFRRKILPVQAQAEPRRSTWQLPASRLRPRLAVAVPASAGNPQVAFGPDCPCAAGAHSRSTPVSR